jgi:hypothetical protein
MNAIILKGAALRQPLLPQSGPRAKTIAHPCSNLYRERPRNYNMYITVFVFMMEINLKHSVMKKILLRRALSFEMLHSTDTQMFTRFRRNVLRPSSRSKNKEANSKQPNILAYSSTFIPVGNWRPTPRSSVSYVTDNEQCVVQTARIATVRRDFHFS